MSKKKSNMNQVSLNDIGMTRDDFEKMDKYAENAMKVKSDPNAIPDLEKMLVHIYELLEEIETPEMQELEQKDRKQFEVILTHKYRDCIPSIRIMNLILESERYDNLDKLLDMFERLQKVKDGKVNIDAAQKDFCEKLNETYVYPAHGGKEGFEKKIEEMKKEEEEKKVKNS
jgi:hypothetical protein